MSDAPPGRGVTQRPESTSDENTNDHSGTDGCEASSARGLDHITMDPGPRRTRNIELLLTEARMAADGAEIDNPAKPCGPQAAPDGFVQDAIERIHEAGLTPAWRVCPRGDDA
jgi:hypothetical protein